MRHARRAFSLIELLVVIVIIGIVAAILLPALAKGRHTARNSVGKANLRSAGQVMLAYLNDSRERFLNPFLPTPQGRPWTSIMDGDGPDYWDMDSTIWEFKTEAFAKYWYSYLGSWRGVGHVGEELFSPADAELMGAWASSSGDPMAVSEQTLWPSSFLYSPVFWCNKSRYGNHGEMRPEDLAVNLLSSVTHPSAKVMLWERADFGQQSTGGTSSGSPAWNSVRSRTDIFTVDGSCDEVLIADLMDQIQQGNAELLPAEVYSTGPGGPIGPGDSTDSPRVQWPPPVPIPPAFFWATRGGVAGRDIAR